MTISTVEAWVDKFPAPQEPKPERTTTKEPMTKVRARNLIDTRMPSQYKRAKCLILRAVVDGIPTGGKQWSTVDIHQPECVCSTPVARLAAVAHVHINTAYLAIAALKEARLISVLEEKGKYGQERYRVSLGSLENIETKKKPKRDRTEYFHKRYQDQKNTMEVQQ